MMGPMMDQHKDKNENRQTRRRFLTSSSAAGGAAMVGGLALARGAHAAGDGSIKIGLIGCGGRGSGAAVNAMRAGKDVKLVAMADIFEDRVKGARKRLKKSRPEQVAVDDEHCFVGFDAYQKVIESGVDVVLIAATSHFHPMIFKAAVDAGKHVFCEKPHGIDVPGAMLFKKTAEEARRKKLSVVSGLCNRYALYARETLKRVRDGAIGDIVALQAHYLSSPYVMRPRQSEWNEATFQFQNWYHFNWLSGDQTAQQLIHCLDIASWAMADRPPKIAWGIGGRQVCVEPNYGDLFDNHGMVFEYADGVRMFAFCRDIRGCYSSQSVAIIGSKGRAFPRKGIIDGETNWRYKGPKKSHFDIEHEELFASIRAGKPINNGDYMFKSSMLAILGQAVCYTGQRITWEKMLTSKLDFSRPSYGFEMDTPVKPGSDGRYPAPMPGLTKFV